MTTGRLCNRVGSGTFEVVRPGSRCGMGVV